MSASSPDAEFVRAAFVCLRFSALRFSALNYSPTRMTKLGRFY
jgi:hypothetical protein